MFTDLIEYPIQSTKLRYEGRMVLRDFDGTPQLMLRLKLFGTRFPQRALLPFVRVDGNVVALQTEIAPDELSVRAYFDRPLPEGGRIEFGYGTKVYLRLSEPFSRERVQTLDLKRLPKDTRGIRAFQAGDDVR